MIRAWIDALVSAAALATSSVACVIPVSSPPPARVPVLQAEPVEPARTPSVPQTANEVRGAIERLILNAPDSALGLRTGERLQVKRLYQATAYASLWTDRQARPTDRAREVLALVHAAPDHGLDPADYDAAGIGREAAALAAAASSPDMTALFDVRVSAALLRYLRHVHAGRIDPREIGFRAETAADEHDYAALVAAAVATDRIGATAAALTPQLGAYGALRDSLRRYRALAADASLTRLPAVAKSIHPGEPYRDASALYRWLLALDDLPATARPPTAAKLYDGWLVQAVTRFQIRHGLDADGVLGARTLGAIDTPLAWRVRQIELGLERLRWLPHAGEDRLVLVNIPMFRLWAWDAVHRGGSPAMSSDVIVGRAFRTRTPLFVEDLREVIFRPSWNIPASILRHEILPQVRRDPGYLASNDMEIVPASGGAVVPPTPQNIARLGRGLSLRQRPGPRNALGLVKFVFPNQESVYMHDTPAHALFSRTRRDFSHGCVRVRDPVALAEWALSGTAGWTRDRIGATMLGQETVRVAVVRPTRVVLFYTTAFVWPEDGTLRFADDIYDHDRTLDRALLRVGGAHHDGSTWTPVTF
jgi:murein L,D-transpeptidase YcbB/YkuD